MRMTLVFLLAAQISGLIIWRLCLTTEQDFSASIPDDVLGVIVARDPGLDLEVLRQSRFADWIELGRRQAGEETARELTRQVRDLFATDLREAWIAVHGLRHKAPQRWRIQFSAFLVPRSGHITALTQRLKLALLRRFGASHTSIQVRENITVYQGRNRGEVFLQIRMPGFLVVSNTEAGCLQILKLMARPGPSSLAEKRSFKQIRSHLPHGPGLFLYVDASKFYPALPEFGYFFTVEDGRLMDWYYQRRSTGEGPLPRQ